ncbi:hypothetical protein L5D93_10215 [Paenibacillus thiaminolyticus]|nr:hypothetical protein [Paenibacillus thiaminolyticus]
MGCRCAEEEEGVVTEGVSVGYTGDAALKKRLDGIIRWAPGEMAVAWCIGKRPLVRCQS